MDLCLMMMHVSRERTILVCCQFFKELRRDLAENAYSQMVLDGKWLRLKHQVYNTELKNVMEIFIHSKDKR